MSTVAQDADVRYLTDDGDPPMSAVIGYSMIGLDSAIVIDNTDTIFLLISDQREKIIGQKGSGACEHQEIASYTVAGDTLFILDNDLGRITGYSIRSGKCVSETSSSELSQFSQIGKFGDDFYLAKTDYNSASSPDESIVYRFNSAEQLAPLDLTVEDLDADLLLMPVRTPRRILKLQSRGGKFYFLLPFSHRIWQYDTQSDVFSSFSLVNESADISRHSSSTDFQKLAEIMSELEFELNFFLLDDQVIVLSFFQSEFRLGAYSYSGDFIAKEGGVPHVDFEENGALYSLESTESETDVYSLEMVEIPATQ